MGGNGILLEHNVGRFVADAEAIYSYEGTREMNTLIVGRALFSYWPPSAIKWLSIPDTFDQFVGEDASDKAAGG